MLFKTKLLFTFIGFLSIQFIRFDFILSYNYSYLDYIIIKKKIKIKIKSFYKFLFNLLNIINENN